MSREEVSWISVWSRREVRSARENRIERFETLICATRAIESRTSLLGVTTHPWTRDEHI
jgi:hypothetical protein